MAKAKGAPHGNQNAKGSHHPGHGLAVSGNVPGNYHGKVLTPKQHTGIVGVVGRAVGLKQQDPSALAMTNKIMEAATKRGGTYGPQFTPAEKKALSSALHKKNFNKPW